MNDLAGLLLGAAALLVHGLLTLAAAPLAGSLVEWASGVAQGRPAPGPGLAPIAPAAWRALAGQPFRSLRALLARPPVRTENASPLFVAAPRLAFALALVAACLVPSFASGLLDAPAADLLLVLGLLAAAQAVLLLAAADDGQAAPGLEATGQMVNAVLAVPGAMLAVLTLSLLGGGTGLDPVLAARQGAVGLAASDAPGMLAAVALGVSAIAASGRRDALSQGWSGTDLALIRIQDGVQILVWIDLVGGLALPGSVAVAQSGPLGWLAGLACWAARLLLGCLLLGVAGARLTTLSSRRRLAGLSVLLALIAPILLLAGRGIA